MRYFPSGLNASIRRAGMGLNPRDRRRAMAVATAAGVHLFLFLLVSQWRPPPVRQLDQGFSVSLIDGPGRAAVTAPRRSAPEPPKAAPKPMVVETRPQTLTPPTAEKLRFRVTPPADAPLLLTNTAPLVEISAPAPPPASASMATDIAATGGGDLAGGARRCEIFDVIQHALQTSPAVRAAVAIIPPKARSVANAVMIWDGGWATPESMGGPPALDPIRSAVLDGVAQAPPTCQDDIVRGPRLIAVGDVHSTTVLAFGSGEWRWSDLTRTALTP